MTTNSGLIYEMAAEEERLKREHLKSIAAARGIPAQNDPPGRDPHRVVFVGDHEPGAIDRDLLEMFDKAWLWFAAACCVLVGFALGWVVS